LIRVFLIDDDGDVSDLYRKALQRTKECYVKLSSTVQDALATARNGENEFDVIVIDVMLPWGPYPEKETDSGLRTGSLLYQDLSRRYPESVFIVLTAYSETQVPPELRDPKVTICNKAKYPPRMFAKLVVKLAGS
jgi:CheY-like chemotaxis protein